MYLSNFISRIYSLIFYHDGYVDTSLCRHMACTSREFVSWRQQT